MRITTDMASLLQRMAAGIKTQPPIEQITDPSVIARRYRYWRIRIMYGMMMGYATFYFVRKNFSMANPSISREFGFSNTEMGIILSVATIVYAFSKFFSGVLADRANARYFMAIGLIVAAGMNIAFGLSSALIAFIIFWALNNLFQGMGMPPCSRLLTLWFSPTESGRAWGIWNASHQIGGAGIVILAGFLVERFGWRFAFIVPALFALLIAFFIMNRLRDTPESMGLPPIEVFKGEASGSSSKPPADNSDLESSMDIFKKYILRNRLIWIVSIANFFVYIVRIGILDWAPKFLVEAKGFSISEAGLSVSAFEIAGMLGAFTAGWISDRIFKGRRGPVSVLFMMALIGTIFGLLYAPAGKFWIVSGALTGIGFFVYGPQMLVAVAATDFATKKAAATAVGLTGLFGYIGATVCGIGTGVIVDHWGWNGGIFFYIASAVIGTLLFLFTWSKRSPVLEASLQNGAEE